MLEVIDSHLRDGGEVLAYDAAIRADTKVADQFSYMRHASPHLERTIEALPEMLQASPEDVVDNVDAVIVTHKNASFVDVIEPRLGEIPVIDVARLFDRPVTAEGYHGIAW